MTLGISFHWLVPSFLFSLLFVSCRHPVEPAPSAIVTDGLVVSVKDQKMGILRKGKIVRSYPVSTSKFGLGDRKGSCCTPLGVHRIAKKIGDRQPSGMVFKSRRPTGEVVQPNSPGRDPIVTRILWLQGEENRNKNAYARKIYIHGTAEERTIGNPTSYGCIRMTSHDIMDVYRYVSVGTPVVIDRCSLNASERLATQLMSDPLMQAQAIRGAQKKNTSRKTIVSKQNNKKIRRTSAKSGEFIGTELVQNKHSSATGV